MEEIFSIRRVRKVAPSYHNYTTESQFLVAHNKRRKIFNHHIDGFINFLDVKLEHQKRFEAQFQINGDKIQMPYKCYFTRLVGITREQNYYSTLFHELVHWTGHKKRLKRESLESEVNEPELYAVEEVTAELGANMLMEFFKLQKNPSYQSLGLINKELSRFDKDTQELLYIKASKQANKSFKYLIRRYSKYIKEENR